MLYDNALLARVYLHGWQALGHPRYRRVCEETLDWALAEMRGPEGGFYSALDADSEGEEGRFYVWGEEEIREVLGDQAQAAIAHFGVTERGNFEGGTNVLHVPGGVPDELAPGILEARQALLERRSGRVRPGLDDKRLVSWNSLMIAALADAGAALGRADYIRAAEACAEFVETKMRGDDGRLLRTFKDGQARLNAYLEDHAFLVEALLALYEATFEVRWFDAARRTADEMVARFADRERGGFFTTSDDHEQLIARRKDLDDNPIPSGNSAAALGLLRLARLTGERDYEHQAVTVLRLLHRVAAGHPQGFGHLLQALALHLSPAREVALLGPADGDDGLTALAEVVRARHRPTLVVAGGPEGTERPELMRDRHAVDGRAAAYVCEHFACQAPVTEPQDLAAALGDRTGA
jgi:uncharacterized protein YyaL (SSP411 family)